MRIPGHGARQIGNRIGAECRAARGAVVQRRRIFSRNRQSRMHICGRAVVEVHGECTHAVVSDQTTRDSRIRRTPGERLGCCHGAVIHADGNVPRNLSARSVGNRAVASLHSQITCRICRIDRAVVRDIAARRDGQRVTVQINRHACRDIGCQRGISD